MRVDRFPAAQVDETKYSPFGEDDRMGSVREKFGVRDELVGQLELNRGRAGLPREIPQAQVGNPCGPAKLGELITGQIQLGAGLAQSSGTNESTGLLDPQHRGHVQRFCLFGLGMCLGSLGPMQDDGSHYQSRKNAGEEQDGQRDGYAMADDKFAASVSNRLRPGAQG